MIRTYLTSASLFAMALLLVPGCGKKNKDSNNPDGAGDGSAVDGTDDQGDSAGTPSHARGSTATRGGGRNTKARAKSMSAAKPPRKPVDEPASLNGMAVEAWKLESANVLPNFDELGTAIALGAVDMVNIADQDASAGFPGMTDLTNNFVLRLNGTINITTEAEYELCINSDDGSQLLLENTVVVDNDGTKDEATEACGLVYLTPGEYQLAIHYFQADGARMALQFAWAQDGGDKALVPSEVLFKPAAR